MFLISRYLPLTTVYLSIVKAEEKSYYVPKNLSSWASTAHFPAMFDRAKTFLKILFSLGILKAQFCDGKCYIC